MDNRSYIISNDAERARLQSLVERLTDDDLSVISGARDQLEGKIQERYGYQRDQVRREVDDWYNSQTW